MTFDTSFDSFDANPDLDALGVPDVGAAEVMPVLIVSIGSSMASLAPLAWRAWQEIDERVPVRFVAIDSLSYDDLEKRLIAERHAAADIAEALPRSAYFQLDNPFDETFDLDNPLNGHWRRILHTPELARAAKKSNSPGCAGTPAFGRARAEYDTDALAQWFEGQLNTLTQVGVRAAALAQGVRVFVYTTFAGGTGTGATEVVAAVLREVLQQGSEMHLTASMPCVYGLDTRAFANATIALRTIALDHSFGERVPRARGGSWEAPFTTVRPIFGSNGSAALTPRDLLMQEVAVLRGQLRVATQSAYNARHVDLNDVFPYDLDNRPLHVRTATAVTIRTVQPGTLEYVSASALSQLVALVDARFERWAAESELDVQERQLVKRTVQRVCADLDLSVDGLLRRMSTEPSPENALRQHLNQVSGQVAQMDAATIKRAIQTLPAQLGAAFERYEAGWQIATLQMARKLPQELTDAVGARLAAQPHLLITALHELRGVLEGLAEEAAKQSKDLLRRRGALSGQLAEQMKAVAEARGWPLIVDVDEATRDAALPAVATALQACLARCEQQKREFVDQALRGELSAPDAEGNSVKLPSAVPALLALETRLVAETKDTITAFKALLRRRVEALGQRLEHRSAVFQRSLVCDRLDRAGLDQRAKKLVGVFEKSEEAIAFIATSLKPGVDPRSRAADLDALFQGLARLVPEFQQSRRTMQELFANDPRRRQLVVELLRGARPFASLDATVLDQQGMRNRRDRLVLLEVPGGFEGPIGQLLVRAAVLPDGAPPRSCIIDSGDDEIRYHFYREGLPYAALRGLSRYRSKTNAHLAKPGSKSPFPWDERRVLPELVASRRNLVTHVHSLLYQADACLEGVWTVLASGGIELAYEESEAGMMVPKSQRFGDLDGVVRFLASHIDVRKALENDLANAMDSDPDTYRERLLEAWRDSDGLRRSHLQRALHEHFATNPYKLAIPAK